jgi:hypothetical protein
MASSPPRDSASAERQVERAWSTGCLAKLPPGPQGDAEYDNVLATVPRTTAPTTLADFGYEYTEDGRLVQKRSQKPFAWLGQKHYDFLGDAIVNDLYAMMEHKYGLLRVMIPPLDSPEAAGAPQIPIFVSPDLPARDVVVLLCQGSGAVRPGMWARALCINNTLKDGTIFSYLDEIQARGWGVVVCNPNENTVVPPTTEPPKHDMGEEEAREFWLSTPDSKWKTESFAAKRAAERVPGSETPQHHVISVFQNVVLPAKPKAVPIIAHSYGGRCTTGLIEACYEDVQRLVPGIAWTDAINDMYKQGPSVNRHAAPSDVKKWRQLIVDRSCNWVASQAPLDTPHAKFMKCVEVSAGHDTHEWTSAACCSSVFRFLDGRVQSWNPK